MRTIQMIGKFLVQKRKDRLGVLNPAIDSIDLRSDSPEGSTKWLLLNGGINYLHNCIIHLQNFWAAKVSDKFRVQSIRIFHFPNK